MRSVLRNRFCRGEKGELREGKVSNRRATEQGGAVHEVAQGGQGPMASKKYGVISTAVLRPPLGYLIFCLG